MKENEMKLDVEKFDVMLDEAWQGRTGPLDEAGAEIAR